MEGRVVNAWSERGKLSGIKHFTHKIETVKIAEIFLVK